MLLSAFDHPIEEVLYKLIIIIMLYEKRDNFFVSSWNFTATGQSSQEDKMLFR